MAALAEKYAGRKGGEQTPGEPSSERKGQRQERSTGRQRQRRERAEQAQGRRIQIAYPGLDQTDRRAGSRDRPQTKREIVEGKP